MGSHKGISEVSLPAKKALIAKTASWDVETPKEMAALVLYIA